MKKFFLLLISFFFIGSLGCFRGSKHKSTHNITKIDKRHTLTRAPEDIKNYDLTRAPLDSIELRPGIIDSMAITIDNKIDRPLKIKLICTMNGAMEVYWLNIGPRENRTFRFFSNNKDVRSFAGEYEVFYQNK